MFKIFTDFHLNNMEDLPAQNVIIEEEQSRLNKFGDYCSKKCYKLMRNYGGCEMKNAHFEVLDFK